MEVHGPGRPKMPAGLSTSDWGNRVEFPSDKQVAGQRARTDTLGDMVDRLSGKQQARGWYAHPFAAMPLTEDNCIPSTREVVPG